MDRLVEKEHTTGELICVSDCLDELVDAGWTVVQETEKRKNV
jgi:hypothetical protein